MRCCESYTHIDRRVPTTLMLVTEEQMLSSTPSIGLKVSLGMADMLWSLLLMLLFMKPALLVPLVVVELL